jgi:hypothetical protein
LAVLPYLCQWLLHLSTSSSQNLGESLTLFFHIPCLICQQILWAESAKYIQNLNTAILTMLLHHTPAPPRVYYQRYHFKSMAFFYTKRKVMSLPWLNIPVVSHLLWSAYGLSVSPKGLCAGRP